MQVNHSDCAGADTHDRMRLLPDLPGFSLLICRLDHDDACVTQLFPCFLLPLQILGDGICLLVASTSGLSRINLTVLASFGRICPCQPRRRTWLEVHPIKNRAEGASLIVQSL